MQCAIISSKKENVIIFMIYFNFLFLCWMMG